MKKPKKGTPTKIPRKARKAPQNPKKPPLTQLAAIARDLLPQAAAQARKGRPRLLAVTARIILSTRRMLLIADEKTIGGVTTADLEEATLTNTSENRLRHADVIDLMAKTNEDGQQLEPQE